ncbi:MAG: Uma2 family endonuclease [Alphaproteobacteria bacterium]|nr:Uma2 family endonuclease [Alphaproteobacteria bacterium]
MDGTTAQTVERPLPEAARRRFTGDDVERMIRAGIMGDKEPYELLGGELIEMPSEGALHFDAKSALIKIIGRAAGDLYEIGADGPLRLSGEAWPEPDVFVIPRGMRPSQAKGPDTLLVVEVSDSSLAVDLGYKAQLYARHGVREYWVVDLVNGKIHVQRLNVDGNYGEPLFATADQHVSPRLAPEISIRLSDLR